MSFNFEELLVSNILFSLLKKIKLKINTDATFFACLKPHILRTTRYKRPLDGMFQNKKHANACLESFEIILQKAKEQLFLKGRSEQLKKCFTQAFINGKERHLPAIQNNFDKVSFWRPKNECAFDCPWKRGPKQQLLLQPRQGWSSSYLTFGDDAINKSNNFSLVFD